MANKLGGAKRALKVRARQAWLLARPEVLGLLPSEREDVSPEQSESLDRVAEAMVAADLYGRSTERSDIKWGIRVLVGELRRRAADRL